MLYINKQATSRTPSDHTKAHQFFCVNPFIFLAHRHTIIASNPITFEIYDDLFRKLIIIRKYTHTRIHMKHMNTVKKGRERQRINIYLVNKAIHDHHQQQRKKRKNKHATATIRIYIKQKARKSVELCVCVCVCT